MGMNMIFSAVSGMKSHQTQINVIGNNIANLNTAGFKGGRALFEDMLVRVFRGGFTPASGGAAAVDPTTVGSGTIAAVNDPADGPGDRPRHPGRGVLRSEGRRPGGLHKEWGVLVRWRGTAREPGQWSGGTGADGGYDGKAVSRCD
jgi:hypothetical protein